MSERNLIHLCEPLAQRRATVESIWMSPRGIVESLVASLSCGRLAGWPIQACSWLEWANAPMG
jgi:hypothetical protein